MTDDDLDLSGTTLGKSDQLDAVDLLAGPRVFTVTRVRVNSGEQPVVIDLAEFPRPWKPGLTSRRVLIACWGAKGSAYVGRQVRLWCDPSVIYGGKKVGGIRITHLSGLDRKQPVVVLEGRGRSATVEILPLDTPPPKPAPAPDPMRRLSQLIISTGITAGEALPMFSEWVGREIAGTKDLAPDEVVLVADKLAAMTAEPVNAPDPYDGPMIPEGDAA